MMDYLELQQCLDEESAEDLIMVLEKAGIPFRRSVGNPSFDVSNLGSVGGSGNAKIIISVPREKFATARASMESDALKIQLPEDHYLNQSTAAELQEMLENESEWSAFDIGHAKRLLKEKGIEPINTEEAKSERLKILQEGKPASMKLLFFGWLFTLTGGLIGFGIGWSLYSMKEKTPLGKFYTYNENSRASGKTMMSIGVLVLIGQLILLDAINKLS